MAGLLAFEYVLLLALVALAPALFYLSWVRQTEQIRREGWGTVLWAFAFGALFATIVAALIEAALVAGGTSLAHAYPAPEFTFLNGSTTAGGFFLILVIAPFVEEGLKGLGVINYRSAIRTVADGPVIGASVGFGFGFFETFLYGLGAFLIGGVVAGIALILLRSISSVLLHGSSTAVFGFGYAEERVAGRTGSTGRHYLAAVGLHAGFNAVVSLGTFGVLLGLAAAWINPLDLLGVALGIFLAFSAFEYIRRLIHQSEFPGALAAHPRFRPPAASPATVARAPRR